MNKTETIATTLEQTYSKIQRENMQGIPVLNPQIRVQAVGFQEYQGRTLGVIITPWMMNFILLPGEQDDWSDLKFGHKALHTFPAQKLRFQVNEIEGIGICQTVSIRSPMNEFKTQEQAVKLASGFIAHLLGNSKPYTTAKPLDGSRSADVDLNDYAAIIPDEQRIDVKNIADTPSLSEKAFDRRSLLSGRFLERP